MGCECRFARGLSPEFMIELQAGRFARLLSGAVQAGLDVQIRENYLSFYHHRCSILVLEERARPRGWLARIHRKYLAGIMLPNVLRPSGDYQCFNALQDFAESFIGHLQTIRINAQPYLKREGHIEQEIVQASRQGTDGWCS